jgi:hypothetical protein
MSRNSPTSSDGQRVPVPTPTFAKAQKGARTALQLVRSKIGSSRHSKRLWELLRSLINRLNISNSLLPVSDGSERVATMTNGVEDAGPIMPPAPKTMGTSDREAESTNENFYEGVGNVSWNAEEFPPIEIFGDLSTFFDDYLLTNDHSVSHLSF